MGLLAGSLFGETSIVLGCWMCTGAVPGGQAVIRCCVVYGLTKNRAMEETSTSADSTRSLLTRSEVGMNNSRNTNYIGFTMARINHALYHRAAGLVRP